MFLFAWFVAPDGVRPPQVESDTPQSLTVFWQPVGRVNALEEVAYLVQFRQQEGDIIVEYVGTILFLFVVLSFLSNP